MQFRLEQVALSISTEHEREALALLAALGITEWVHDTVRAKGTVLGKPAENTARLSFNYTALVAARELELLRYVEGDNWLKFTSPRVSHIGMHCSEEELAQWDAVLHGEHGLEVVQEVHTQSHVNPEIAGKRWYHYVIYGARDLIGVDIKFIVRRNAP